MWSPCVTGATYSVEIDWNSDGIVTGVGENITEDILGGGRFTFGYGRDQARQLSPSSVGRAGFTLCNVDRIYSPENRDSPLFRDLGPAREVTAEAMFQNVTYPLFVGGIDDFTVHPDRTNRTADFSVLDGLIRLQGTKLSTEVFRARRTGEIINLILDEAGWPTNLRDVDHGASYVRFWWEEDTDAFTAIQEVVRGEGPPAIAYIGPDGTFIYRDRHHRLMRAASLNVQATFASFRVGDDCPVITGSPVTGAPPITGTTFEYTAPFEYHHGWRDIVNVVQEDVEERSIDGDPSVVWSTDTPFTVPIGQTLDFRVVANDPFINAITPVAGIDYDTASLGTPNVTLLSTSGQAITLRITALGGDVTFLRMQLRAQSVPVSRTVQVSVRDPGSISVHGERVYPNDIPLVTANDVLAVGQTILAHYSLRRPLVRMRVVACDPGHLVQIFTRTISDRIRIINAELGMDDDFFVERVDHVVTRINPEKPPVHAVVLGCERDLERPNDNPFTFDVVGAGFDDGFFDPIASNNPATMWVWDSQSEFDVNKFAT